MEHDALARLRARDQILHRAHVFEVQVAQATHVAAGDGEQAIAEVAGAASLEPLERRSRLRPP